MNIIPFGQKSLNNKRSPTDKQTLLVIWISLILPVTGNGLGYKYNYGIQHSFHGHHYGSSYPHAYGGYDGPGYHIGGGYYNHV
jgi:hypothetical protein